jgi:arsenate reductase-like glutaredoxin family protein
VVQPEFVSANKVKIGRDEALRLVRESDELWVARGKKLLRFEMAASPSDEALAKVILGRSGNLRAPAFRVGQRFVVGFHAEGYAELFG